VPGTPPSVPSCPPGHEYEGGRCWSIQTDCARSSSCGDRDPNNDCHATIDVKSGQNINTGFLYGRHCGLDFGGGAVIDEVDRWCEYHDQGRWGVDPRNRHLCDGTGCSQTVNFVRCVGRVAPRSTSEARAKQVLLNDTFLGQGDDPCIPSLYAWYEPHSYDACRCSLGTSDQDGDGVPDRCDTCRSFANSTQDDADGDHVGDACDDCEVYDPGQRDDDLDGVANECETDCTNGIDDDGNGQADANDRGCVQASDPSERDVRFACDDGLDNDADGAADYPSDPGCPLPWAHPENPTCDDGVDNNADGLVD
jgi:hypothetical protein